MWMNLAIVFMGIFQNAERAHIAFVSIISEVTALGFMSAILKLHKLFLILYRVIVEKVI